MADLNNALTGMTPIDVVPAERIVIITTGSVCNPWRAKEPGRETMTRAARRFVDAEAQMQWGALWVDGGILRIVSGRLPSRDTVTGNRRCG